MLLVCFIPHKTDNAVWYLFWGIVPFWLIGYIKCHCETIPLPCQARDRLRGRRSNLPLNVIPAQAGIQEWWDSQFPLPDCSILFRKLASVQRDTGINIDTSEISGRERHERPLSVYVTVYIMVRKVDFSRSSC